MNGNSYFKKRIVIIESDEEVRQKYMLIINSVDQYQVVASYDCCESAIARLKNDKPDIIILDLELNGMNGIEGIFQIKRSYLHIEVLVISSNNASQLVYDSLCAGASGFIVKNANYLCLITALDQLTKGGAPMSCKIARMVVESFRRNHLSPLSARETDVMRLLSKGHTYSSIGKQLFISKETVKTHLKNIYQKLQVRSKAEAVTRVLDERYI